MSLEDDLAKLERQVNNFSIAGAAGNFHTGFSIGDDARGSGAGAQRVPIGPAPEDRIAFLEQSFRNFTIRGGHDVSVSGSLVAGGFAISAKQTPSGEGTGGGPGPTPTGACCIGTDCFVLTSGDCATMSGLYQGDDVGCSPNPCIGACCHADGTCSITTEAGCVGTYQGDSTDCDPNPCPNSCCCGITTITVSADIAWTFDDGSGVTGMITASVGPVDCPMTCTDNNPSIPFCIPDGVDVTAVCDPTCEGIPPGDGVCVVDGSVRAGISGIGCDIPGQITFSLGSSGDVFYCQEARWDTGGGLGTEGSIPCDALGSYDFVAEFDPGLGWRGSTTFHVTVS